MRPGSAQVEREGVIVAERPPGDRYDRLQQGLGLGEELALGERPRKGDSLNPIDVCLAPFKDGHETPTKGQVLTHWKSTKKWALVDPLSGEAAPCRLVARGVGRFAACKGSAAEFVSPISMRHRLPFAHYAAPYAAVLACKSADECSEFCEEAGLCAA